MEKLNKVYSEWRVVTENMLNEKDGNGFFMRGSVDCGEQAVRRDFSDYAELETEISFENMLELEEEHNNREWEQEEAGSYDYYDDGDKYVTRDKTLYSNGISYKVVLEELYEISKRDFKIDTENKEQVINYITENGERRYTETEDVEYFDTLEKAQEYYNSL